MKKILILILLVLFCSGSAFCGFFEDALKKAEQGDVSAQFLVGFMYKKGEGIPQDFKQAFYWYKKSAEQELAMAQNNLGFMYYDGKGVTQNFKQAYIWWSLAAAQGNEGAIENRNIIIKKLSPQQLSEAQELAAEMQEKIDSSI